MMMMMVMIHFSPSRNVGTVLLTPNRLVEELCIDDEIAGELSVAVARAIYRGGDILLGDEPVSSIDPHQANTVLQIIRDRVSTVVLSLHDVDLALELFDRIIGLRAGRLEFDMEGDHVDRQVLSELYRPC